MTDPANTRLVHCEVGGNFGSYGGLRFYGKWRPVLLFHNGTPENTRIDTNIMDRLAFTKPTLLTTNVIPESKQPVRPPAGKGD